MQSKEEFIFRVTTYIHTIIEPPVEHPHVCILDFWITQL